MMIHLLAGTTMHLNIFFWPQYAIYSIYCCSWKIHTHACSAVHWRRRKDGITKR